MKLTLEFEPDVENYKLENIDHLALGAIEQNAYQMVSIKTDDYRNWGIGKGSLHGEAHNIKQVKREMLEDLVEAIALGGYDIFNSEYYMNRTLIENVEYLVAWVIAKPA